MANLGPFDVPRRQPSRVDPFVLAQALAAPDVAREQARSQISRKISQFPRQLASTFIELEKIKREKELFDITKKEKAAEIGLTTAKTKEIDNKKPKIKKVITPEQALKMGAFDKEEYEIIRPASKTGAQSVLLGIVDKYNALPEVKDSKTLALNASRAKGLIDTNSPIAQEAAKFSLARATHGGGVLTEQDVNRLGGSKAFKAKVQSALEAITSGNLGSLDRKFLFDLADAMEKQAKKQLDFSKKSYAGQKGRVLEKFGIGNTKDLLEILDIDLSGLKEQPEQSEESYEDIGFK